MERHFALPIAIATAIHAGLLFGFRSSSVVTHTDPRRMATTESTPPPPVIELQPKDDAAAETPPAKGSSEIERPTLPELPPPEHPEGPVMTAPPSRPASVLPGLKIDLSPPGVMDGSEMAIAARPGLVGAGQLDNPPRARLQTAPQYPFEAKRGSREGTVTVEFTVDENGAVLDPRVVNSTDRVFEEATLRAVAKWRFEPGRRAGRIVRFRMAVPVVFNLRDN